MRRNSVYLVVGLSGVGKTSVCKKVAEQHSCAYHIGLGAFVREYLTRGTVRIPHGVGDGSSKPEAEAEAIPAGVPCALAFLDAVKGVHGKHILVDTGGFVAEVGAGIYCSDFYLWELTHPTLVLVILAKPETIRERHTNDSQKSRAAEQPDLLTVKQDILIASAASHAAKLGIPIAYIFNSDLRAAADAAWAAIERCRAEDRSRELLLGELREPREN